MGTSFKFRNNRPVVIASPSDAWGLLSLDVQQDWLVTLQERIYIYIYTHTDIHLYVYIYIHMQTYIAYPVSTVASLSRTQSDPFAAWYCFYGSVGQASSEEGYPGPTPEAWEYLAVSANWVSIP